MRKLVGWFVLFSILTILLAFPACTPIREGDIEMQILTQDEMIISRISGRQKFSKLRKYLEKAPTMEDFAQAYHVEYFKSVKCSSDMPKSVKPRAFYTVMDTDKGLVCISFDEQQAYSCMWIIWFSDNVKSREMDALKVGMDISDVQEIDPSGNYSFGYISTSEVDRVSYHYFIDGNCYVICYDEDMHIIDILHHTL